MAAAAAAATAAAAAAAAQPFWSEQAQVYRDETGLLLDCERFSSRKPCFSSYLVILLSTTSRLTSLTMPIDYSQLNAIVDSDE